MNFDELDQKMRIYERSLDQIILPEIYLVARIDGRNFTRLTGASQKLGLTKIQTVGLKPQP